MDKDSASPKDKTQSGNVIVPMAMYPSHAPPPTPLYGGYARGFVHGLPPPLASVYVPPASVDVNTSVLQQSLSDAHRLSEQHMQENQGLVSMIQTLQQENAKLRMK